MGELLIRNANIFDGYGSQPFVGDILVHDDRIRELGPVGVLAAAGAELIDVGGYASAPGSSTCTVTRTMLRCTPRQIR